MEGGEEDEPIKPNDLLTVEELLNNDDTLRINDLLKAKIQVNSIAEIKEAYELIEGKYNSAQREEKVMIRVIRVKNLLG